MQEPQETLYQLLKPISSDILTVKTVLILLATSIVAFLVRSLRDLGPVISPFVRQMLHVKYQ